MGLAFGGEDFVLLEVFVILAHLFSWLSISDFRVFEVSMDVQGVEPWGGG